MSRRPSRWAAVKTFPPKRNWRRSWWRRWHKRRLAKHGEARSPSLGRGYEGQKQKGSFDFLFLYGFEMIWRFTWWWSQTCFFSPLLTRLGEMIQFDKYFSDGLKPPTREDLVDFLFLRIYLSWVQDSTIIHTGSLSKFHKCFKKNIPRKGGLISMITPPKIQMIMKIPTICQPLLLTFSAHPSAFFKASARGFRARICPHCWGSRRGWWLGSQRSIYPYSPYKYVV